MSAFAAEQMNYMLRIVLAALCGGLIGYERQNKKKSAGVRTHVIIAVASAMMMIISKYGFNDVLGEYIKLDPSRVAAGIVTAIGFIGSGIIVFRNNSVNGITTSAGIWATVGLGMAMGSGMYVLGILSTFVIMIAEAFLGRKKWFSRKSGEEKEVEIEYRENENRDIYGFICRVIKNEGCRLENIQLTEEESDCLLTIQLYVPSGCDMAELVGKLKEKEVVKKISVQ